jgi:hypothetical protein
MLWVGIALFVIELLAASFPRSFRGNWAGGVVGDVNQTYTEAPRADPAPKPSALRQERFIKWFGLVVAFAGLIIGALKLFVG